VTLREDSAILLAVANAQIAIEDLVGGIAGSSTDISEGFEAVSDKIFETAEEQIRSIKFQQLSAEEQIETLHKQAMAALESQKALLSLIESEERRAELLGQIEAAEEKQLELYNLQKSELQKLNEEREREIDLMAVQNVQSGLRSLLSEFERTIDNIAELVQGLFDQVYELLFSDFNLMGPQDKFILASQRYQELLTAALDPEATEDEIKDLQAFVNEYLSASRDVYKSSTQFQHIFEQVLKDLETLGVSYGTEAPIQAIDELKNDLKELFSVLDDDFADVVDNLITNLDQVSAAFLAQKFEIMSSTVKVNLDIEPDFDTTAFVQAISDLNAAIQTSLNSITDTITETIDSGGGTGTGTDTGSGSSTSSSYFKKTYTGSTFNYGLVGSENLQTFLNDSIETKINKWAAVEGASLHGYVVSYKDGNTGAIFFYDKLATAQLVYDSRFSMDPFNTEKYGFRTGGLVPDPMDTIPAMLSPGEYILSPETVRRYGVSNLNRLNSGDTAALNATSDPEVKRLLAELIVAVRENDTEVNVYTDMAGQTKAGIEEFRSELRERTRRQGDKFLPARYI
jgi:hypothetical protein